MPKKALASLDIYKLLEELDLGETAFVRNVKSRKNEFYLQLFGKKEAWIRFVPGSYMCAVSEKPADTVDFPFTLKAKSLLKGKRVSLRMHEPDRIVEVSSGNVKLIVELFSSGNLVLTDNGKIVMALYTRSYGTRNIREGVEYSYPPGTMRGLEMPAEDAGRVLRESDRESVVKALAIDFYLGGTYAEEVVFRSGVDKNTRPADVTDEGVSAIVKAYEGVVKGAPKPNVVDGKIFSVIELTHIDGKKEYFDGVNSAVTSFFSGTGPENRRENRIEQEIEKTGKKVEEYGRAAVLLESDYDSIAGLIRTARTSSIPLEERTKMLKESGWELSGRTMTNTSDSSVSVDLIIPLREQISDVYDKIKRARKGLDRRETGKETTKRLKFSDTDAWYGKFRWSTTGTGKLLVIGRDVNQNAVLVEKHGEKNDVLFHADIFGSPFGLVKSGGKGLSEEEKKECASLVCSYSSAWRAGAMALDVYYVEPEQATKTPPSGESLKKGAFYIKGKRNYVKNAELGVYIGVESDDSEYRILIYGHEPRGKYLLVRPGSKSREETVKRIRKIIEQRLGFSPDRDKIDKMLPAGKFTIERVKM